MRCIQCQKVVRYPGKTSTLKQLCGLCRGWHIKTQNVIGGKVR